MMASTKPEDQQQVKAVEDNPAPVGDKVVIPGKPVGAAATQPSDTRTTTLVKSKEGDAAGQTKSVQPTDTDGKAV